MKILVACEGVVCTWVKPQPLYYTAASSLN